MYEIEELERKWRKYKRKRLLSLFLKIVLTVPFLVVGVFFYLRYEPLTGEESKENASITAAAPTKEISKSDQKVIEKSIHKTPKTEKIESDSIQMEPQKTPKEVVLKPSMDFLNNLEEYKKLSEPKQKRVENRPKPKKQETLVKETKSSLEKKNKNVIKISKSESEQDVLKTLEKRFNKNKDPKTALFLSKAYYNKKDYVKALKWAIIANDLDSSNPQSWILFAKSSVKLGKKEQAVKALETFLRTNDNIEIKEVLYSIRRGELK